MSVQTEKIVNEEGRGADVSQLPDVSHASDVLNKGGRYLALKKATAEILNPAGEGNTLSKACDVFIIVLIFLNVLAVILESVESIEVEYFPQFEGFALFSVAVFTLEYVLRVWSCTVHENYARPVSGRLRYMVTPMALIDLLAILPFYLPFFLDADFRFLRILRLFRMFALFKLVRYSRSMRLITKVVDEKKEELLVSFTVTVVLLILASGVIYFLENEMQPEVFSSIPAAMWWGVSTMTTVGYGDIYPLTPLGKLFGGIVAILGLGTFGLPAGILAYGFIEEIQNQRYRPMGCPHCGKQIDLPVERRRS